MSGNKVSQWLFVIIAWKEMHYACLNILRWSMLRIYYIITPVIKCMNNQALWHIPESTIAMEVRECIVSKVSW